MRPLAVAVLTMAVLVAAPNVHAAERQGGGVSLGFVCEPGTTRCTCQGDNDCDRLEAQCPTKLICDINTFGGDAHCCCGPEEYCDPIIYPKPTRDFRTIVPNTPTLRFQLQQPAQ